MGHPISGPISPEELKEIAQLPYGKAAEELRKHDPAWGLATPDKPLLKWEVTLTANKPVFAVVEVEAPDEEAARKMALNMYVPDCDWEDDYGSPDDIDVGDVEVTK